jgi:putative tryptophan/tyrosine transport system substrate-binding protein
MRRRDFIAGLGGATAWPLAARAQQSSKIHRVAWISASEPIADMNESSGDRGYRAFIEELRRLGYIEGRNLILERYSGEGNTEHYGELANDLVRTKPDLIFTSADIVSPIKSATVTIPIVVITGDPLVLGLATSLAHPGGNITGVSVDGGLEIWGKRLALLKEVVPGLSRVGFLVPRRGRSSVSSNANAFRPPEVLVAAEAGHQMGISVFANPLDGALQEAEYRRVFAAMSLDRLDALIVSAAEESFTKRRVIVELAEQARLPAIYAWPEYVELGGLMAYAADLREIYRHTARQIDQILKGAKPQDIPFYQAAKYDLILNLKTAKALGLTIPETLLATADEVIQ